MDAETIIIMTEVFLCMSVPTAVLLICAILNGKRGGQSLDIWTEDKDEHL